jgi:hypothetical protein
MTPVGFPHSDIAGSKVICTSPTLIAAYHVLHRLPVPRHPPGALSSLTKNLLILLGEQAVSNSSLEKYFVSCTM